jgi:hypothetical protein
MKIDGATQIAIIHAPGWFSLIWKIVSPLINEVTQKKVTP